MSTSVITLQETRSQNSIQRIINDPNLSESNRNLLTKFESEGKTNGLKSLTRLNYLKNMRKFTLKVGKDLREVTKEDVQKFFDSLLDFIVKMLRF